MRKPRLVVGVLSSERGDFRAIRESGQKPTWVKKYSADFPIIFYSSKSTPNAQDSMFLSTLDMRYKREELRNHFPVQTIRRIRKHPSRESKLVTKMVEALSGTALRDDLMLWSQIPDSLSTVGARTLEFFRFAIENFEFDYLVRTNTSSYLSLDVIQQNLSPKSSPLIIHGLTGKWGRTPYPSGALYAISREQVEKVLENSSAWIHDYIDDVALGLLLRRLVPDLSYRAIPRFDYPLHGNNDYLVPPSFGHFRCKARDPEETITRMQSLFQLGM